jgi:flavorubredoxin
MASASTGATTERFNDEVNESELMAHAAKYYANILLLYSPLIQKLLADVRKLGLKINMIAPDHGLIWRKNPMQIVEAYEAWGRQLSKQKALVVYDTMWQSTEIMAKAVTDGLVAKGVTVKMMNLAANHRSDVMTEVLDAKAVILGSATLNNGMLPRMADMISYMKGLKPLNKIGAAFGSYGWSGEAPRLMATALKEMKFKVVGEGLGIQYAPTHELLTKCVELGREVARAMKEG